MLWVTFVLHTNEFIKLILMDIKFDITYSYGIRVKQKLTYMKTKETSNNFFLYFDFHKIFVSLIKKT